MERHGWSRSTTRTLPACCRGCARPSRPGWTHLKPGRPSGGRGTYNARPHETVHGAPEDVEKQPATSSGSSRTTRQVPAQQGPHRPAREGGGGRGRLPSADERGEELQQLGAVDSMTVRSTGRRRAAATRRWCPEWSGCFEAPGNWPGFFCHTRALGH